MMTPRPLYFDADQYEVDGDRVTVRRGAYFYPWQVAITADASGKRTARIKPGVYALRGIPKEHPIRFIEVV